MPANTPHGLPYPLPTEPVAEGAAAIRALAEGIATSPWIALPLANYWVPVGAPFSSPAYYKDGAGRVHLKGVIKSGLGSPQACWQLPAAYLPAEQGVWSVISIGDLAARLTCNIGTREFFLVTTANSELWLDDVSWRAVTAAELRDRLDDDGEAKPGPGAEPK